MPPSESLDECAAFREGYEQTLKNSIRDSGKNKIFHSEISHLRPKKSNFF